VLNFGYYEYRFLVDETTYKCDPEIPITVDENKQEYNELNII